MQIVINISEELYQMCKSCLGDADCIESAIANGTPLPKGHGKLIEVDENLYQSMRDWCGIDKAYEILHNALTIIEADKPESENT